ncbi:hypothetical protein RCL1_006717 [Eukaryota sp. TZLM3-RCL]
MKPQDIVPFYFDIIEPSPSNCPEGKAAWRCRFCSKSGSPFLLFIKKKSGFKNMMPHITKVHPNYLQEIRNARSLEEYFPKSPKLKYDSYAAWLEWIVEDIEPFNFVERATVRKYSYLEAICSKTMKKIVVLTYMECIKKVSQTLPNVFGLAFDGWKHPSGGLEFLGLFAAVIRAERIDFIGTGSIFS